MHKKQRSEANASPRASGDVRAYNVPPYTDDSLQVNGAAMLASPSRTIVFISSSSSSAIAVARRLLACCSGVSDCCEELSVTADGAWPGPPRRPLRPPDARPAGPLAVGAEIVLIRNFFRRAGKLKLIQQHNGKD